MRRIFSICFSLCGFAIPEHDSKPSWTTTIYSAVTISTWSLTYVWTRFMSKIFAPTKAVVSVLDKLPVLSSITTYEIVGIICVNIYHAYSLVSNKAVFLDVFKHGRVLNSMSALDLFMMALSLGLLVPQIFRELSLSERCRYVSYAIINSLNHMIIFQYCAILNYHTQEIRKLTILLKPVVLMRNENLIMICLQNYFSAVSSVRVANKIFSFRVLVIFVGLAIDMAYLACYCVVRMISESISPMLKLYWSYLVLSRLAIIVYMTGCCDNLRMAGDEFILTLFNVVKRNDHSAEVMITEHKYNRLRLVLRMKPNLTITACGLFTYGYPLVISIVEGAATYLTILIQFSLAKK